MEALLDKLAKHLWMSWLTCIAVGVAAVVLDAAGYDTVFAILGAALAACMVVIIFNALVWQSRAHGAPGAAEPGERSAPPRNWPLLALMGLSLLAIGAVYAFDLPHDLTMPLVASAMIPLSLKNRSECMALLASRQPTS
jgi:hypothetical protein